MYDPKVVIEAGIVGREIECGILDGHNGDMPRASYPGEIEMQGEQGGFYDFEAKYVSKTTAVTRCPANLPPRGSGAYASAGGQGILGAGWRRYLPS